MLNTTLFDYSDFMQFVCNTIKDTDSYDKVMSNPDLLYNDYLQYKKEEFMKKYDVKFIYKTDRED